MVKKSRLITKKERADYLRRERKKGRIVTFLMPNLTLQGLRELIRHDNKPSKLVRFKRIVKKIKRRIIKRRIKKRIIYLITTPSGKSIISMRDDPRKAFHKTRISALRDLKTNQRFFKVKLRIRKKLISKFLFNQHF